MNKKIGLIVFILCGVIFCGCSSQEERDFAERSALDVSAPPQSDGETLSLQEQAENAKEQAEISDLETEIEGTEQAPVLEVYDPGWSEERILEELEKRKPYRDNCSFYSEVMDYMEKVREVTDISMYMEPLYATDTRRYTEEDFADVPPLIIHLAKNEIYARHGYVFQNEDISDYFMGQLWYRPSVTKDEFDDSVFNEYETENIMLLSNLDTL